MYINGIQCDVCCKTRNNFNMHHDPLPEGWLSLAKGDELERMHFCSLHCLHDWVEKQFPVVEEVKLAGSNRFIDPAMKIDFTKNEADEYWRGL